MLYVKLLNCDYLYEVNDILRLFYSDDEIVSYENEPPLDNEGVFLFGNYTNEYEKSIYRIEFLYSGKSSIIDLPVMEQKEENPLVWIKKQRKLLKRELYIIMAKQTGKQQPWGILTGIRPAKRVHKMLLEGLSEQEIIEELTNHFWLSGNKAKLVYNVAMNQKDILKKTSNNLVSLYFGIPFCTTRCLYCSFTSNPISKYKRKVVDYLNALKKEIEGVKEIIEENNFTLQSIYIGGGTPTSIDAEMLKILLNNIEASFNLDNIEEFSLEAGRPDSIDMEKLNIIKKSRVNRISINPQTMNDVTLKLIGRSHTAGEITEAFRMARELGFDNINMDVIVGLPGENLAMFENTLKFIEELGPESLTVHTMAIKKASILNQDKEKYELITTAEASEMLDHSRLFAEKIGMHPYYLYRQKNMLGNLENIGYCKPGCESIYNIQIMEEKQTIIALGAGGVTKVVYPSEDRLERAFNVKSVEEYIDRVDEMIVRKRKLLNGSSSNATEGAAKVGIE
jgi:coproporphyrinogen dehydrogenase HemZ